MAKKIALKQYKLFVYKREFYTKPAKLFIN